MMFDLLIALLLLGAFVAMVLFIWFDTNAFVEYTNFFGLHNIIGCVAEFNDTAKNDPVITYPEYLVANHNSFFTRMLSCPKCLCVQLCGLINFPIFFMLQVSTIWLVWLVYPFIVLVTAYFALYLYYQLVKLIKQ